MDHNYKPQAAEHQKNWQTPLADGFVAETSDDDAQGAGDRSEISGGRLKERPELAHHLQNDSSILAIAVGIDTYTQGHKMGDFDLVIGFIRAGSTNTSTHSCGPLSFPLRRWQASVL